MINHPYILRIRRLFPFADKLLLHLPVGIIVGLLTLIYSHDPYEIIRNATDIGLMKEVWDYGRSKKINLENLLDLLFTIAGGILVALF